MKIKELILRILENKIARILTWPFRIVLWPLKPLLRPIKRLYHILTARVHKSIRLQLIATFALCLFLSMFVFIITNSWMTNMNRYALIDYSWGVSTIDERARSIVAIINDGSYIRYAEEYYAKDEESIEDFIEEKGEEAPYSKGVITSTDGFKDKNFQPIPLFINRQAEMYNLKILLTDLDGNVIYKSETATESKVDIHSIIRNAMNLRMFENKRNDGQEFVSFYPLNIEEQRAYAVVSGIPSANIIYVSRDNSFVALLLGLATFFSLFYFLTKRKMQYIEELAGGLLEISKGNLDYRVTERSEDELGSLANNVNYMAEELKHKIEEERKAEQTKNELITNVSHDLRTPLTSIMGYLRLVKDKNYKKEEEVTDYINIAYGKSEKLKVLIEDLFEYTKLSNQGAKLNKEKVCLGELLEQLIEEMVPLCEENELKITCDFPDHEVQVNIDPDKIVRVFENLLTNAVKFSFKPGEIQLKAKEINGEIRISVINRGEAISKQDLDHLFERFYRIEKARSSDAGGSGLGLAIAKNIIELHGGKIWAECEGEEISFNIELEKAK